MTENQCEAIMCAMILQGLLVMPAPGLKAKELVDIAEGFVDEIKKRTLSLGE